MASRSRSPVLRSDVLFPALLQVLGGRAGRLLILVSFVTLLVVYVHWTEGDTSPSDMMRSMQMRDTLLRTQTEMPHFLSPEPTAATLSAADASTTSSTTSKWKSKSTYPDRSDSRPVHVLVTSNDRNVLQCRQMLSSFAADYPPLTMVASIETPPDDVSSNHSGTGIPRIQALHRYFEREKSIRDNDLLLILDGHNSLFQLPPDVLKKQYSQVVEAGNTRSRDRYGPEKMLRGISLTAAKYSQSVIFAASKSCEENAIEDLACAAAPEPPEFPSPIANKTVVADFHGIYKPPRFLHSTMFMGPARHIRTLVKAAVDRAERNSELSISDQMLFASLFGQQELAREQSRHASTRSPWSTFMEGLFPSKNAFEYRHEKIETPKPAQLNPDVDYELAIGLDYSGALFQTVSPDFPEELAYIEHTLINGDELSLPPSLSTSKPPFANLIPQTPIIAREHDIQSLLIKPFSPPQDHPAPPTPDDEHPSITDTTPVKPDPLTSWAALELATNTFTKAVPAIINTSPADRPGPEQPDDWERMWYHPHLRAILEQYMKRGFGGSRYAKERMELVKLMANGGIPNPFLENLYGPTSGIHDRGGRGGVWTDTGLWQAWGAVCTASEFAEGLFPDGQSAESTPKAKRAHGLRTTPRPYHA
ncbi:hypothetical protein P152DRAFT_481042 [Eremomyces bilateralis CBS 781.70]|uniref:Uncharacterized protein n=1 Tax=Eremomyces bilateralis CBS 781.70 TaxID=1392243 RepID=A0A6G1G717_9PEZI|nr:uncharacterized protein P152DRAFT_481042 [Eremomyces bilateralis CBS 781.70]KAF1813843.1 hypothetical protein P152DRAFT_481042 [Eremomyces bilateralis CBS 781.70]